MPNFTPKAAAGTPSEHQKAQYRKRINGMNGTAHAWRSLGSSPIPIRVDGSKGPVVPWAAYQTEQPTAHEIDEWFGPHLGLGIVTGIGGVELLEFETEAAWVQWCRAMVDAGHADELRALGGGYCARSGSGGYHLIYRTVSPDGNHVLAGVDKGKEVFKYLDPTGKATFTRVLIETRGTGGYVIVAGGDPRVHPSGRAYQRIHLPDWLVEPQLCNWIVENGQVVVLDQKRAERAPRADGEVGDLSPAPEHLYEVSADLREEMFALARQQDRRAPRKQHGEHSSGLSKPTGQGVPGVRPGEAWSAVTSWPEILEPHGWRCDHTTDASGHWTRPGKSFGTSATTNYNGSGLLYVFTTSTDFSAGDTYTKFGAYALLNHGGDHVAAARMLVGQGYGDPLLAEADTREQQVAQKALKAEIQLEANEIARRNLNARFFRPPPEYGSLADQRADPLPEPGYVVDSWILDQGIHLVVAQAKAGKTTLVSLDLTRAMLHGEPWLDEYATHMDQQANIGIWNMELEASRFQRWLFAAGISLDDEKRVFPRHLRGYTIDLLVPQQADDTVRWLQERNVKVWIIDPLTKIYLGDTNADSEFNTWWRALESVIERAGVRVCIIPHHAGHNSDDDWTPRARGTSAMIGNPDVTLVYRHGGKYGDAPPDSRRYLSAYGRDVDMAEITIDRYPETNVLGVVRPDGTFGRGGGGGAGGRAADKLARLGVKIARAVWAQTTAEDDSTVSKSRAERGVTGNTNEKREALDWCVQQRYLAVEEATGRGKAAKVRRGEVQPPGYVPLTTAGVRRAVRGVGGSDNEP